MQEIIIGGIIAFIVTFYAIPVIITVAKEKKLYDEPDDKRKIHTTPIPSLGGLGMFVGFTLCLLLTINFWKGAPEFQFYLAGFMIIFFLGIKDDILVLSAGKKLIGQIMVAAILMFKADLLITNMQGFLGIHEINQSFSYLLTIFTMIVIINAFNLIDGVDGLAGSVGLVTCLVFGTFFLINGNIPYAVLGFGFAGSLLAFLIYNFSPAKIFMGDTGSLMVGLVNTILVIKFIETGNNYAVYPTFSSVAVGFGIMVIPLMDTLRVFTMRIFKGKSPFSPDRNHLHHLLLDKGYNHKSVALTCSGLTLLVSGLSFVFQGIGTTALILVLIAGFFGWVYILYFRRAKNKLRVIKSSENGKIDGKNFKMVSFFRKESAIAKED